MNKYIAVVSNEGAQVTKYQDFDTESAAIAHVDIYGGCVAANPGGTVPFWVADSSSKTLTYNNVAEQTHKDNTAWRKFRIERDKRLLETDWWASSDLTMSSARKQYRTDLRNLPASTSDPTDVTWPTKPS